MKIIEWKKPRENCENAFEKMLWDCENALENPHLIYKADSVKYVGKIPKKEENGGKYYTEYISHYILENGILDKIKEFCRAEEADYHAHDFSKIKFSKSDEVKGFRREENIAYGLCKNSKSIDGSYSKFLDYQYPVVLLHNKDKIKSESFGKLDLIYKNQKITYITELKHDKSPETLLRCVTEISTYYHQINKKRFCEHFNCNMDQIGKAVMIFKDTKPYQEYTDMMAGNRPNLKKLCEKEGITFFRIESDNLTLDIIPCEETRYTITKM